MEPMEYRINVARAVTPGGVVEPASILIKHGRIAAVEEGAGGGEDLWAVPGFVDTHCHGAVGVSFGHPDPRANQDAIDYHRSHGTTTLFASTVARPLDQLQDEITVLRQLVAAGELAGIHLEGPFLSPEKRGAHEKGLLIDPTPDLVDRLLATGGGAVKMVTLAVEREGAEESTRRFTGSGCTVALGHSSADAATTRASIEWGTRVATHLFNAMNSIHHRDPGPVPVLLEDGRVMSELICDGFHLDPIIARLAIDVAGVERICLVTDAMSATGHGDGRYVLGDLDVIVTDGKARLATADGRPGAIAGSTLTMAKAFEFVVQEVGLGIPEAATIAATTPAAWHGLGEVGSLEPGKWADICLVDDDGVLHHVVRRGRQM